MDDEQIVDRIVSDNLFQYPTERMTGNIARVCLLRLNLLADDLGSPPPEVSALVSVIADGAQDAAAQANLYLMMRSYDLVEHFMVDLVGAKYDSFDYSLAPIDVNAFLSEYQASHPEAASWTDATRDKLRQVLRKCLVETGQLESARSSELRSPLLDFQVEAAMRANGDARMLGAFDAGGGC